MRDSSNLDIHYTCSMESLEIRVHDIEIDLRGMHDRLGKVEDSAKSAWHTINEAKDEIGDLKAEVNEVKKEVNEMKVDVKGIKAGMETQAKYIKWLAIAVGALALVIATTALVALAKGSDTPQKVVELLVPVIDSLKK